MTEDEKTELRRIYELILDGSFYEDYDRATSDVGILRKIVEGTERDLRAKTSYTVMDKANARLAAQELLITGQEVKVLLDGIVKVGTAEGRNMVFNKWEAANKIAQIVNDRFNARRK